MSSNDVRRGRYLANIRYAMNSKGPWGPEYDAAADAAMAVADEGQRGVRENLESAEAEIREQDAELARLRAESNEQRERGEFWSRSFSASNKLALERRDTIERIRDSAGLHQMGLISTSELYAVILAARDGEW